MTPEPVDAGVDEAAARLRGRPWPARPLHEKLRVTFECFPPSTPAGVAGLDRCLDVLRRYDPRFISVTYGAGGSTQDRTIETVGRIAGLEVPVAGHLTCVGRPRREVDEVVATYLRCGVSHIVALRGDPPEGQTDGRHPEGYRDAAELVGAIRARCDLGISVAAYPEVHPRAPSARADLDNLKRKLDAGATQAITQFFFDADVYLRFLDRARAAGITAPIVPGIMPVTNLGKVRSFAERCGASVPPWLLDLFDGLDDAPEIRQLVAATTAAEQCRRLAEHGIRDFHFYTMNKPELTAAVCRILGVRDHVGPASRAAAG